MQFVPTYRNIDNFLLRIIISNYVAINKIEFSILEKIKSKRKSENPAHVVGTHAIRPYNMGRIRLCWIQWHFHSINL